MSPLKDPKSSKVFWKSENDLAQTDAFVEQVHREFPEGASEFTDPVSRRKFLKIMGASAALAGLTGCDSIRRPVQTIRPYAKRPETVLPGNATYYATSLATGDSVVGVLVASHEGRPTKIEGNPLHSMSNGKTNAWQQADILNLYDPDRLQTISYKGKSSSWDAFKASYKILAASHAKANGAGLGIVFSHQPSPSLYRMLGKIQQRFPKAVIAGFDPINADNQLVGIDNVTGQRLTPVYRMDKADVIVSFGRDFLGTAQDSVKHSQQFSTRRDPEAGTMNRLYMFESAHTLTGGKADHRFRVKSSEITATIASVFQALVSARLISSASLPSGLLNQVKTLAKHSSVSADVVKAIVSDLRKARRRNLILVDDALPAIAHSLAYIMNEGNATIAYRNTNFSSFRFTSGTNTSRLSSITDQLNKKKISTLIVLGGNPAYQSPEFATAMDNADVVIAHSTETNQTTEAAHWVLPASHSLEAWGDLVASDGSASLVQPLIRPLYASKSAIEVAALLANRSDNGYRQVRDTWRSKRRSESDWKDWLHNGVISRPDRSAQTPRVFNNGIVSSARDYAKRIKPLTAEDIEVVLSTDSSVYDGRYSNNGWLQEMPDPITKLTWDNAALVSPRTAKRLGLSNDKMIELKHGDQKVKTAVFVVPGMADNSISLSLGYGKATDGRVGNGTGFDAYKLLQNGERIVPSVTTIQTFDTYALSSTQDHMSLEGRPLFQEESLDGYKKQPDFAKHAEEVPHTHSSWEEKKYDTGYQWGMSIDLSKCTGCNACVIGCQAENNIPIVGKEEVANGREMHWIRVDRYFEGEADDASLVQQPVTCLQCENAPCEQVCPVAATVHSDEGLNDMVYNRCVGTRYCSDNCPAKVRRFNFFDYHQRNPQAVNKEKTHLFDYFKEPAKQTQMQFNPDVTVRMRGVMEKCTYCVQRINQVKATAANQNRTIKDGEVQTACQQACPANAITFGNIRDKDSEVSKRKKEARDYEILRTIHLKARTTYLASITNPNPALVQSTHKGHDYDH